MISQTSVIESPIVGTFIVYFSKTGAVIETNDRVGRNHAGAEPQLALLVVNDTRRSIPAHLLDEDVKALDGIFTIAGSGETTERRGNQDIRSQGGKHTTLTFDSDVVPAWR